MDVTDEWLRDHLSLPQYPRSAGYDQRWVVASCMGPHPLWLLEDLLRDVPLEPGMRVLDLGCGKGLTSVYLAREHGVQVFAADLWIEPEVNARTFAEHGVADRAFPLKAEAHALPFAPGWFDAVVSVDAYQYFGTDDLYLGYLTRFVRPGGHVAIAVPGVTAELTAPPTHLRKQWDPDFACLHTARWWRDRWTMSGRVEVTSARAQDDGWRLWARWSDACARASDDDVVRAMSREATEMLALDAGRTFAFPLVVGRVHGAEPPTA